MTQNVYFGILVLFVASLSTGIELRCCSKPPRLMINGKNIFHNMLGNHTLVAFVEGNKMESKKQVRGLDLLLNNFLNMDVLDITFIAINRKTDNGIRHLRRRAVFDIYQEPETSDVWEEMGVATNDFVVFDHCGYMVGTATFPSNFLWKVKGRVCTDKLIRNTYTKPPCKKHWKCLRQPHLIHGKSSEREPEVFSIVESSNGTFNSPLEKR